MTDSPTLARPARGGADTGHRICIATSRPVKAVRDAMAELAGLREVLSAQASFDVTPQSGGRFHVTGRVRARIGQTCVVTLEPIENDIDEADRSDLRAAGADSGDGRRWSTRPPKATTKFPIRRSRSRTA